MLNKRRQQTINHTKYSGTTKYHKPISETNIRPNRWESTISDYAQRPTDEAVSDVSNVSDSTQQELQLIRRVYARWTHLAV